MQAVQMNTRLDAGLKREGDSVLADLGFTPSQAVRALWRFVVDHRERPERILQVLSAGETDATDEASVRVRALKRGRDLCAGLEPVFPDLVDASYKELRDAVFESAQSMSAGFGKGDAL